MGEITYISMSLGSYIKHTLLAALAGAATGFVVAAAASQLRGTDVTTEFIREAVKKELPENNNVTAEEISNG